MNFQTLIIRVIQASIFITVFSFGLNSDLEEALHLVRRPSLLARSLLSMYIIMPLFAVSVMSAFEFRPAVEIAMIALAVSPVPPLLPQRELKVSATSSYAHGLLLTAALVAIIYVPLAVTWLGRFFQVSVRMGAGGIAEIVLITVIVPFALGMAVGHLAAAWAGRMAKPLSAAGMIVLAASILPLFVVFFPSLMALIGNGTILVIVAFVLVGLAVGHLLGGPEPGDRGVLALSTAVRHPAVALAIAGANFPDEKSVPAAIALYLILNAIVSIPYLIWRRPRKS